MGCQGRGDAGRAVLRDPRIVTPHLQEPVHEPPGVFVVLNDQHCAGRTPALTGIIDGRVLLGRFEWL